MKTIVKHISKLSLLLVLAIVSCQEQAELQPTDLDADQGDMTGQQFQDVQVTGAWVSVAEEFNNGRVDPDAMVPVDVIIQLSSGSTEYPDEIYLNGAAMERAEVENASARFGAPTSRGTSYTTTSAASIRARDLAQLERHRVYDRTGRPVLSPNLFKIKCKIDFVLPGEDCFGDKCPTRSLLGGKTWFCFCVKDCEVEVGI